MAAAGMDPNRLVDLLAGSDRPIRMALLTGTGAQAGEVVESTVGEVFGPSSRSITFTVTAEQVVGWTLNRDLPEDDDED